MKITKANSVDVFYSDSKTFPADTYKSGVFTEEIVLQTLINSIKKGKSVSARILAKKGRGYLSAKSILVQVNMTKTAKKLGNKSPYVVVADRTKFLKEEKTPIKIDAVSEFEDVLLYQLDIEVNDSKKALKILEAHQNSLKGVIKHLPRGMAGRSIDRYKDKQYVKELIQDIKEEESNEINIYSI